MDTTALVVIGLAVVVIVLVLLLAGRGRRRDLVALPNDSRERYLAEWDRIEMRFMDAPGEAVSEADALVVAVLRERRHPLGSRQLPNELHTAREEASLRRGDKTEGMRRAMLHYRALVEKTAGKRQPSETEAGRREMA
jgi:hypothetical protein